jgi:hypothetical protein
LFFSILANYSGPIGFFESELHGYSENTAILSIRVLVTAKVAYSVPSKYSVNTQYFEILVMRAAGVPRYLPTKNELVKAIQFLPEDQFAAHMMEYYRRYHAGNEVRGPKFNMAHVVLDSLYYLLQSLYLQTDHDKKRL